jgi:DHA2 family multidrug resistance protein
MSPAGLDDSRPADWHPHFNPWLIAWVVTIATFMEVLDTSIANVALPHIAGSLAAGVDESTWVLTTYLVANAIILPLNGFLSSVIGRKRYYMLSVALFTVSSFLCGVAPSLRWLIFFRALQGLGGGGLQPVSQAVLLDSFPVEKIGMAMAMYGLSPSRQMASIFMSGTVATRIGRSDLRPLHQNSALSSVLGG